VDVIRNTEALCAHIKAMLKCPGNTPLDVDALDGEFRELGEALAVADKCLAEQSDFAKALSKGDIEFQSPMGAANPLTGYFKTIQSNMRHLAWKARQVAEGDYTQKFDFMGEFSDAFNGMVDMLRIKEENLMKEIRAGQEKTRSLENMNKIFINIATGITQGIAVINILTHEVIQTNPAYDEFKEMTPGLAEALVKFSDENIGFIENGSEVNLEFDAGGRTVYYTVIVYTLIWDEAGAIVFVIKDTSAERLLKEYAFQDELTGLFNRFYGMKALRQMVDDKRRFTMAFVDMDNLKYVNDNFGHGAGDGYIRDVAGLLRVTSPDVTACRLGGDEFMVIFPERSEKEVWDLLKSAIASLQELNKANHRPYYCNISFGCIEVDENTMLNVSEILGVADERMYEYKKANKKKPIDAR